MKTGRNPHQYQFLTRDYMWNLDTKRLLGVLRTARALHGHMVNNGEFKDPLYTQFQKYIDEIKYILAVRPHVEKSR